MRNIIITYYTVFVLQCIIFTGIIDFRGAFLARLDKAHVCRVNHTRVLMCVLRYVTLALIYRQVFRGRVYKGISYPTLSGKPYILVHTCVVRITHDMT